MKIILSNNAKRKLMLSLCFLCMAVIFILSSFPAQASGQQSGRILGILSSLFGGEMNTLGQDTLQVLVRKTAHVLEFTVLGGLWYGYFLCTRLSFWKRLYLPFGISVLYALSDEVHQYFVPGRAARMYDVGFDTIGIILGIGAVWLISRWLEKKKGKLNG